MYLSYLESCCSSERTGPEQPQSRDDKAPAGRQHPPEDSTQGPVYFENFQLCLVGIQTVPSPMWTLGISACSSAMFLSLNSGDFLSHVHGQVLSQQLGRQCGSPGLSVRFYLAGILPHKLHASLKPTNCLFQFSELELHWAGFGFPLLVLQPGNHLHTVCWCHWGLISFSQRPHSSIC